jgi:MOSC domain-containing protein YiiM
VSRILSVNAGRAAQLSVRRGRPLMSGIVKTPVAGPVAVGETGLAGDEQADLRVHGGPDKAVYAYAIEDTSWWEEQLGRPLPPGMFGENLTVEGVDVTGAVIGERWLVGSTELEVCQPRSPCSKLGLRFGDPKMVKRFAEANRPGAYLRVIRTGELAAGDAIDVRARPEHGIDVALVSRALLLDDTLLEHAARAPALPAALAAYMHDFGAAVGDKGA